MAELAVFLFMTNEEVARRERLEKLRELNQDPYPARVTRTHTIKDFLGSFEELEVSKTPVTLVGRIKTKRKHGGLTFLQVEDGFGVTQMALKRDSVGEDIYNQFHETIDMADFIEATGTAFVTRKGQNTLDISSYKIISKALSPLPEKWHGLTNVETRYRQRELDLIANEHVRNIFRTRAAILTAMRKYLDESGFLEVETPILQAIPGGANAKPFVTHHNALDMDMYLRIAPELYLKRLTVGGFERVYEVSRCFRNEGIDHSHNPEFTQIEGYMAYADFEDMMTFMEGMVLEAVLAAGHDPKKVPFQEYELDFSTPWKRMTYKDALMSYAKVDLEELTDRESASKTAMKLGVPVDKTDGLGTIIDSIYKHLVRPKIIQPTYLYDYPAELSPLAKRKADDPRYVEMFQLVYGGGVENIKAFSELNDPIDQEARFKEQDDARSAGDEEAQFSDMEYVNAMKHGMPPQAGFGIGIDRLTATLTDSHNIKEVILFPTLRPERME